MKRCRTGRHRSFLSRHRRLPMLWWWFHHPKLYLQSDRYLYILQILSSIHMYLQYIRNQLDSFYYSRLVRLHTKLYCVFVIIFKFHIHHLCIWSRLFHCDTRLCQIDTHHKRLLNIALKALRQRIINVTEGGII